MRGFALIGLLAVALVPGLSLAANQVQAPVSGKGTAAVEKAPALTGDEMVERSRQAIAQIQKVAGDVQGKLTAAQESKDTIRSNCLGERLNQVKGLLKNGEAAAAALKTAAGKHDADAASREYAKVEAIRKKVDEVAGEAGECVGESAGGDGQTGVDVLAQPELEDASNLEQQTIPGVRPAAASPTR